MRYGMMNFPVNPVIEEILKAADLGMDYLELAMDSPHGHFSRLNRDRSAIAKTLRRNGLGLTCHLPAFVFTAHLSDAIRQASVRETTASLETASDLGAELAVVHPGYIDGLAVHVQDEALRLAMDSLDHIRRRAEKLGMVLCVENLFPGLGPFFEPAQFASIFESFPGLKLALDVGHAHIGDTSGARCMAFISRFKQQLAHLHVSDNRGRADDHLPIGQGTVPFEDVAAALRQIEYDGTVTLEIFGQEDDALRASRRSFGALMM